MKKIFKKWYFWVILFFLVIIISSGSETSPVSDETSVQTAPGEQSTTSTASESSVQTDATTVTQTAPKKESAQPKPAQPVSQGYKVTDVVDGDTIKISMNEEIETLRLIGMDTPETVDPRKPVQCFGKEASSKGKELLLGKTVTIEADSTQDTRDKYGRLLVYVYRDDGLFYNKYMIEQGYAHEYTYEAAYKHQKEFKAAEQSAKTNQKGLWSPATCNGNTTSSTTPTPSPAATSSSGKYYTSSHYSAKYYYPESCDGWKGLSPSYLKSFNSLEDLLSSYPDRSLSPGC